MLALALLLLPPAAHAGVPVVSAAAGWEFPTDQPWAGLELAVHPDHDRWIAPVGRLALGWGFGVGQPLVLGELGLVGAYVSEEDVLVRFGVVGRLAGTRAGYAFPVELAPEADVHTGLIPGVMGLVEFEWGDVAPFTVGARAGVGSAGYDWWCEQGQDIDACLLWSPAFIGGFYGRLRLGSGWSLEAIFGPTAQLSIGHAF